MRPAEGSREEAPGIIVRNQTLPRSALRKKAASGFRQGFELRLTKPVMPALVARLSGSNIGQQERELAGVHGWWRVDLAQARQRFAMHEIGSDQSCQLQHGILPLRDLLKQMKKQVSDKCDGDLDADGIVGAANEMRNAQHLFHQPEKQLDIPYEIPLIKYL